MAAAGRTPESEASAFAAETAERVAVDAANAWVTLAPARFADASRSYAVQLPDQSGMSQSWSVWYEQPAGNVQGQWAFVRPGKHDTEADRAKGKSPTALVSGEGCVSRSALWQGSGAFEIDRAGVGGAAARHFPSTIDNIRGPAGATSTSVIVNRRNTE